MTERLPFHLAIPVADLDAAQRFYVDVLGARVGRVRDDWVDVLLWGHQITLQLSPSQVMPVERQGKRHFGVVLPWWRWEMEVERLKKLDAPFLSKPNIRHEGEANEQAKFYLADPGNNIIEVKAYRAPDTVLGGEAGVVREADDVLRFWFGEIDAKQWWAKDEKFDALIAKRFGAALEQAGGGELWEWRGTARGRLAEILVLDQFSRNAYRDTPRAFAQDPLALVLAQEAVAAGLHRELSQQQAAFLLMPYMHSESARVHGQAEALFREYAPKNLEFELKHKAIVDRFGRYPHRNAILGRKSTPEELEFLKTKGSSF